MAARRRGGAGPGIIIARRIGGPEAVFDRGAVVDPRSG
jgi:hypothetical protein